MKYDILMELQNHLNKKYKKTTAIKYFLVTKNIFRDIYFDEAKDIDVEILQEKIILGCKTKNDLSALKMGLKNLKEVDDSFNIPSQKFFEETKNKKRNYNKKKKEPIEVQKTINKINRIRDKKYRLALQVAVHTGLRVFELANLKKENVIFNDDGKTFDVKVIKGKGNKDGVVTSLENKTLYFNLKKYLDAKEGTEKLFYAESTLRKKANSLNIQMHDLRRIFAHKKYEIVKKESNKDVALVEASKSLRHSETRVTKKYLYKRKFV